MNNNISILAEAKKEYTNQLTQILKPRLYEGFKSMYDDTLEALGKEMEERNTQGSSVIKTYQKMLKDIPNWNQITINKEYERILQTSKCDYLDDLIEAVFVTNIKILSSVQINTSSSQNLNVNVPSAHHFIHKCYIECAKEIYKNPYVFDNSKLITPKEKHTNLREVLNYADNSINSAIRELLPIREILKQGLTKRIYEEDLPAIQEQESDEDSTVVSATSDLTESVVENDDHVDTDKLFIGGNNEQTHSGLEYSLPENEVVEIPAVQTAQEIPNNIEVFSPSEEKFVPPPHIKEDDKESNTITLDDTTSIKSFKDEVAKEPETKEIIFGGNQTGNNYKQKFNDIKKITIEPNGDEVKSVKSAVSSFIEYPRKIPSIYPPHKQKNISSSQIDKKSSFYKKKYAEYLKNLENSSVSTKRTENTIILDDASEYESDDNLDF